MATNRVFKDGDQLAVIPTDSTVDPVVSGAPILFGDVPGVALTDADSDDDDRVTAAFKGVFEFAVKGANGAGNSPVAEGDVIYMDGAELNKDATNGTRFGVAM